MRNDKTPGNVSKTIHRSEELDREDRNAELALKELESISGGRITNVRANVAGLGGGGLPGTTQLLG